MTESADQMKHEKHTYLKKDWEAKLIEFHLFTTNHR